MSGKLFTAALFAALFAAPAMAEQFVVQLNTPFDGANEMLLKNLQIVEVDSYTLDGAHYMVIEAPDVAYLESYFYAIRIRPKAVYGRPDVSALSLKQRLPFLTAVPCEFCAG